ncbi:Hypothetical predicted protein [Cloeon dipterum]|uniref:26S proteasome non-ATPase regulatory subunit 3 N-terminal TPR repeats domain-containing protein n=1 Tax=Cloeon dipterum TaxID=197152 RepID=A0A8S1D6D3_9INSE|nr:Hypothetical predicted protein [Cloeon dipterum]
MGLGGVSDVEMKDADSPVEVDPAEQKKDADLAAIEEIREHTRQIEKAVHNKEQRFILRVLRALPNTRRRLNGNVLRKLITGYFTHSVQEKDALLAYVEESTESDTPTTVRMRSNKTSSTPLLTEVDTYIHLLVLLRLLDTNKCQEAVQCSTILMNKVASQNRRTIDLIAAKSYYYHSRAYELTNQLNQIRGFLHARLRTATLRNDFEGQAVLINSLLRNYLHYHLYDQADKLVSKSVFPELASNNEWARHFYYLGRIKAIQLEYSAAHKHLLQAIRKAPQHTAVGFKQTVQKLAVVVELLLGDIPERQIFRHSSMRRALIPYFQLTQG